MLKYAMRSVLLLALTGCSVRLGGPKPEEYHTLAWEAPAGSTAAQAAQVVKDAGANIVLVTATEDSAWFADVSHETGLALSGPGHTEPTAKAFLTNLKILGDTSIVLGVGDGSRMHMHDALYEIAKNRQLDLMLVGISARSDLREAVRTLLSYVATDVGANAAIVLAVTGPSPEAADSVVALLRAAYGSARECAGPNAPPPAESNVRLLFGPSARIACRTARTLTNSGSPIVADLIVGR